MEIPRQIYVFSPTRSDTVKALLSKLHAHRLVRFDGLSFLYKGRPVEFNKRDVVICWGVKVPQMLEPRIVNANTVYLDDIALNKNLRHVVVPGSGVAYLQVGRYTASGEYDKQLEHLREKGITAYGSGNYVPCSHLYGYYYPWFRYEKAHKISVVNGKVISAEQHTYNVKQYTLNQNPDEGITANAIAMIKNLGLDFGVVYFLEGKRKELFLKKVITAPTLTQEEADEWVDALLTGLQ